LKNSFAVAELSVVEKFDPLKRPQSDASEPVDGLKTPKIATRKARNEFFNRIDPELTSRMCINICSNRTEEALIRQL
jgi:hypothetical protein